MYYMYYMLLSTMHYYTVYSTVLSCNVGMQKLVYKCDCNKGLQVLIIKKLGAQSS